MISMALQESTEAKEGSNTEPFPDADIRIGSFTISGVRTFIIILLIVATYCYLAIRNPEVEQSGMRELALMAVGFLFGAKIVRK